MTNPKTEQADNKQITPEELWFCWNVVNQLQAYLTNQIEAGAEGADQDYDNANEAKKIINRERFRLLKKL